MHEEQYIACALEHSTAAGVEQQRECCVLPGKRESSKEKSTVAAQHPAR